MITEFNRSFFMRLQMVENVIQNKNEMTKSVDGNLKNQ